MVIRLLPNQIPQLWNQIKYAAVHADRIESDNLPVYLNNLLHSLLSDKAQCFIRFDNDRQLLGVMITTVAGDSVTGERSLVIRCLYSFKGVSQDEWNADAPILITFAQKNNCKKIITSSSNHRIHELALASGFKELYRTFAMEV